MCLYSNGSYMADIDDAANADLPWEKLKDKRILISGATGLVGSFLIDVLMRKNETEKLNCTVYALSRKADQVGIRFSKWSDEASLIFIPHDINDPLDEYDPGNVDYVLHMASNTHPMQYAKEPITTITTNIIGVQNMLEFAVDHHADRFAFISSNEIYGENRGDVDSFDEDYCGYINCNTLRAGYPESKRCGEALCQAYKSQKALDVVVPRLTRSYGPTMRMTDTKAISQFIRKAAAGEDIVLKSAGNQLYSFTYVADAVTGLLYALLKGKNGEAYNVSDERSDITLKELAAIIASIAGTKVVYEIPDVVESAGYSTATKALLNGNKIRDLGWKAKYDIRRGLERTIAILKTQGERDGIG